MSQESNTHKQMVRKSLFRTISRSLIRQLCENGFDLVEAVDLINEMLGEVVSLGLKNSPQADAAKPSQGEVTPTAGQYPDAGDLEVLKGDGKVDIDDGAYIRALRKSDCGTLRTWQADPEIVASLASRRLQHVLASEDDWDSQRQFTDLFVICRKGDDQVVGMLGFTEVDRETKQAEFSKMIGEPSERGKGRARGATKALLNYGFDVLGLNRIYLHTLDGHLKNIRLNQSLGFQFEGLLQQAVLIDGKLRDVAVMALLKSQHRPADSPK
ncbi:MAG: GNAT family N-acetyltransferase [Sedimentisphaerales bacterium]|nr:GNAT family N-acetyltransferase [Sedimentisphaerales bacterium]